MVQFWKNVLDLKEVRDGARKLFTEVFKDGQLGDTLEKHIYNYAIVQAKYKGVPRNWDCKPFRFIYISRIRGLRYNILTNSKLLHLVLSKEIKLKVLANMTPQEMNPELYANFKSRAIIYETVQSSSLPDGAFTCGRCKTKKTTYYELQTRCADEPMTAFISCHQCGKHWKQ
jgi:DNA-directed RNA polymerase subunit M/transcription elongation factor TFIIS